MLFKYCGKSGICAETRDTPRARSVKMKVVNLYMIGEEDTLIVCQCGVRGRNVDVSFCWVRGG